MQSKMERKTGRDIKTWGRVRWMLYCFPQHFLRSYGQSLSRNDLGAETIKTWVITALVCWEDAELI
jgi:hypothetical protein